MEKITIEELQGLFSLIIEHFKSLKIKELQLNDNWYWKVDENEKFAFEETPKNLNIGNYLDDIERAKTILENKSVVLTDLSTLSNILNCIETTLLKK